MSDYGKELILDLHECDAKQMTRKSIKQFCEYLCEEIDMEPCKITFWDDKWVPWFWKQTNPKTIGVTAVQFILTSNITIHALTKMGNVHINVFSCKEFDSEDAEFIAKNWFKGKVAQAITVCRI